MLFFPPDRFGSGYLTTSKKVFIRTICMPLRHEKKATKCIKSTCLTRIMNSAIRGRERKPQILDESY